MVIIDAESEFIKDLITNKPLILIKKIFSSISQNFLRDVVSNETRIV